MVSSNFRGNRLRCLLLAAAGAALFLPAAAFAAPWAYAEQFGDLIRGDLATGEVEVVGPTGFSGQFSTALADDGAGHFYSLGLDPSPPATYGLYRIDAATGAAVRIGDIGPLGDAGLEFGPDGQLYLAAGESLFQIDPDTAAQTGFFPLGPGSFLSLAAAGGALYGLVSDPPGCHLHRLDPAAHTSVRVISNVPCAYSMAGDPAGRIWMVSHHNGVITGTFSLRVDLFDPETVQVEPWAEWDGFEFDSTITRFQGLAAVGPVTAVDIPVTGPGGLALLAAALACAGTAWLKRA